MVTVALWIVAVCSFVGFFVAVQIGPSCAASVGPWAIVAFLASVLTLAGMHDLDRWKNK
jgi:hypothetical protein